MTDHGDTSPGGLLPRLSQADAPTLPSHLEKLADRARDYIEAASSAQHTARLGVIKAARSSSRASSSGFDLVAVKQSVVDEEIARLGLNFTSRASSSRRYVHSEAYTAGRVAGSLFEPNASLDP